jgi:hypothetical protein
MWKIHLFKKFLESSFKINLPQTMTILGLRKNLIKYVIIVQPQIALVQLFNIFLEILPLSFATNYDYKPLTLNPIPSLQCPLTIQMRWEKILQL